MAETLSEKQQRFSWLIAKLILYANASGYQITFGEAYRTREQAALNAKSGIGIANSLHCDRLAIDLNLFRDGKYLTRTEDYQPLGEWWIAQSQDCKWGGLFKKPDGNHFSVAYMGRA